MQPSIDRHRASKVCVRLTSLPAAEHASGDECDAVVVKIAGATVFENDMGVNLAALVEFIV